MKLISCDWKACHELLDDIEAETKEKPKCFTLVDSKNDEFWMVVSDQPITKEEAQKFYDDYIEKLLNE